MSLTADGPEAQDALFPSPHSSPKPVIPEKLQRATLRLEFPPSYVVVGVYRLITDRNLWVPAWDKCRHAVRRGAIVGGIWAFVTFKIQKKYIEWFLMKSPRVTGLSHDTIFGFKVPFSILTFAALMFLGTQLTFIFRFFLSRNINIARDRVWDQTVASRGKAPDFFGPYVEEFSRPPLVKYKQSWVEKVVGGPVGLFVVKQVLLAPFDFYPFVGTVVSAWFKALGTSKYLHRQYFEAKKMNKDQVAVFIEERKWDYRTFGFAAAILEGLPIIGLVFTVSNRIGAAMWAYDLEKRQHFVAEEKAAGRWVGPESKLG
ncbi:hypothetical protein BDN70DRAFT_838357 [Pholiota conissans]|uniref:Uncharacterized protein n=1 Tax=Pholiota conissans TaxID=109636 RepID=A0A9P5YWK2_9AGAR|nr:hypothetical protein BDN70DRAFT_838357 [Pholiota conissans]